MLVELLVATLVGILTGTLTGLTPGLHTNTLAVLLVSLLPLLPISLFFAIVFLLSMSVVHTVIDAIPSIFLGVPDSSMVIGALPGHKMLLAGDGFRALQLTALGSLGAILTSALASPILYFGFVFVYPLIKAHTFWLLVFAVLFILYKDQNRLFGILFIILSGLLGWSTLQITQLQQPLFHLLTGLFGTSLLIMSLYAHENDFPKQKRPPSKEISLGYMSVLSFFAGSCAALLPGVGSAQVALLAQSFVRKSSDALYLLLTGGINTANMFVSLVTLLALDKARNGSVVALNQLIELDVFILLLLFGVMLISAGVSGYLLLPLSRVFLQGIRFIGIRKVTYFLIFCLVMLAFIFDGFIGLAILLISTLLGIATQHLEAPKHYLMGCLLVPVLVYFLPF